AGAVGSMNKSAKDHLLIGERSRAIAVEPQHIAGAIERVGDQAAGNHRSYGMELKLEGCRNAEVSTATAHGPEKIGLLLLARAHALAFGGDKFDGAKIVEGKTVFANQPAQPTAESEPSNSCTGHNTARDRQGVQLRLAVELTPGDATLRPRRASLGI